jgi:iron complex transport system permease protein
MEALTARRSDIALSAALLALVMALALASLTVGPAGLPFGAAIRGLIGTGSQAEILIIREIRLPRMLLAIMVGGSLGLSGAALQGLLRNPLAAPSLFGAPSAAAFAAVSVIALGLADTLSFTLPAAAMGGAMASVALLILVAGPRASLLVLILAGLAISSLAAAGTSLALNLAPNPFAALEIAFWLLGSLEDRSFRHVLMAVPFIAGGCALLAFDGRSFRALTLGEDAAASLGVNLTALRLRVVTGVAAAVGAGVAVAGTIGFVGLVAPHLVRGLVRHDPGRLMLPASLAGAALLLAADIGVRLVPAQSEIKVGVVTALIGAPFFILLVFRRRRDLTGAPE